MAKIKTFLASIAHELQQKVVWPAANTLYRNVGLVVIGALVFALLIGVLDYGIQRLLTRLYGAL